MAQGELSLQDFAVAFCRKVLEFQGGRSDLLSANQFTLDALDQHICDVLDEFRRVVCSHVVAGEIEGRFRRLQECNDIVKDFLTPIVTLDEN